MVLILASLTSIAPPGLLFGLAAVVVSAGLLVATRKRWSHTTPLTRCVALSVWIHVVLLGMASLTNWWTPTPGRGTGRAVRVAWVDAETFLQDAAAEARQAPSDTSAEMLVESAAENQASMTEVAAEATALVASTAEQVVEARGRLEAVTEAPGTRERTPDVDQPDRNETAPAIAPVIAPLMQPVPSPPVAASAPTPGQPVSSDAIDAPALLPLESESESESETAAVDNRVSDQDAAALLAETRTPPMTAKEPSVASPAETLASAGLRAADAVERNRNMWKGVATAASLPQVYQGRSAEQRDALLANAGGSPDTEAAVQLALQWLANAQNRKTGGWDTLAWGGGQEVRDFPSSGQSVQADTAVTGLALLAFLGAGHTTKEGQYQQTVQRGIDFLVQNQSPRTGSLAGRSARYAAMYSHGIATFALGEALVMSGDARLREPLRRAVGFTIAAQHPVTGGWRYEVGDQGDTSQFGWQVMALVSARTAGVEAPPETWRRAELWLSRVALGRHGGLACYVPEQPRATPSMTAEAAVGHLFLRGSLQPDAQREAAEMIARHSPAWSGQLDLYYTYYATLAMYLSQDEGWPAWNQQVIGQLLPSQRRQGPLAGSWDTDSRWGSVGGRVYTTALACLCLETYYRYLPSYQLARSTGPGRGWTSRQRQ